MILREGALLRGSVTCAGSAEWLELTVGAEPAPRRADRATSLDFELPRSFEGRLLARVRYPSGEIWRRELTLP